MPHPSKFDDQSIATDEAEYALSKKTLQQPLQPVPLRLSLEQIVVKSLAALKLSLVIIEHASAGLMRIFIERSADHAEPPSQSDASGGITIADCEAATRQLQYVFTVENIDYARLEVSSPGLDRPLIKLTDYIRFVGCPAAINLKKPLNGRRQFKGTLLSVIEQTVRVQLNESIKNGLTEQGSTENSLTELEFDFSQIDRARLIPQYDFRNRKK